MPGAADDCEAEWRALIVSMQKAAPMWEDAMASTLRRYAWRCHVWRPLGALARRLLAALRNFCG